MSWHILGAGSLGCLWAARLALAGADCRLILRNRQRLQQYQQQGGQLRLCQHGSRQPKPVPVAAELADATTPINNLLVSCKAYDAEAAVDSVKHRLDGHSRIYLLQNGMGSQQQIVESLPAGKVLIGSSTEGAYLSAPFCVVHAGRGLTRLGRLAGTAALTAAAPDWSAAGIDWQWDADISAVLWHKLAINCMINPLTVLHGCKNSAVAQHMGQLRDLAVELAPLLSVNGCRLSAEQLLAQVQQVIIATGANTSSMLQDVQAQRRTEISYITGFALAQAERHGLSMPVLRALHEQLQQRLLQLGLPAD